MESFLDQAGVFSFRVACALKGIASSMLSTSKKASSFRAVELGLRMPQSGEGDFDVIVVGSVRSCQCWWSDVVAMMITGTHCVRTRTVGSGRAAMRARVWETIAAAEEALKAEVCSLGGLGFRRQPEGLAWWSKLHAADEAGDRGGDSACAGGAHQRPSR